MGKLLVPDELWALIEPILPKHPHVPGVGQRRKADRVCLTGILFVLKTAIPWEDFPQEMGCCGMTLWNCPDEWRRAAGSGQPCTVSCWTSCAEADRIDFARVIVDSSSVRAVHGGKNGHRVQWIAGRTGRNTTSSSSMPAGFRWPARSPGPTATT